MQCAGVPKEQLLECFVEAIWAAYAEHCDYLEEWIEEKGIVGGSASRRLLPQRRDIAAFKNLFQGKARQHTPMEACTNC
jgi:hypothetical protein